MPIRIYSENSIIYKIYLVKTIVVAYVTWISVALFSARPVVPLYNDQLYAFSSAPRIIGMGGTRECDESIPSHPRMYCIQMFLYIFVKNMLNILSLHEKYMQIKTRQIVSYRNHNSYYRIFMMQMFVKRLKRHIRVATITDTVNLIPYLSPIQNDKNNV